MKWLVLCVLLVVCASEAQTGALRRTQAYHRSQPAYQSHGYKPAPHLDSPKEVIMRGNVYWQPELSEGKGVGLMIAILVIFFAVILVSFCVCRCNYSPHHHRHRYKTPLANE
jgi:hypothetical protein